MEEERRAGVGGKEESVDGGRGEARVELKVEGTRGGGKRGETDCSSIQQMAKWVLMVNGM